MEEYLKYATKGRVREIQDFLGRLEIKPFSRDAIESALRQHPEKFRVIKRGTKKYVALKKL
jgi:hypothetical protein